MTDSLYHAQTGPEDGEHLVFLHCVGASSAIWSDVVELLPEFRCTVIDLPGHGRSLQTSWASLEDTAQMCLDLIADSGRPAHLVTLSLGSYVALTMLARAPARFASALLSGVQTGPIPIAPLAKAYIWLMAPLINRPAIVRRQAWRLGIPEQQMETYLAALSVCDVQAFRRACFDCVDFTLPDLSGFHGRLIASSGSKEMPGILSSQPQIARAARQGRALRAPGLHHGWPGQAPTLFADLVRANVTGADVPKGLEVLA